MSGSAIGIIGLAIALSPINKTVGSVVSLGILAVPLSMGVGILKYRLYDIDRLISRTLSYAVVTGDTRRRLHRPRHPHDEGAAAVVADRRRRINAHGRCTLQPGEKPRAASHRSPLQPSSLRR